jgi:hypothetical protein
MDKGGINWELVRYTGELQGATRHAVSKWRQRNMIPHKWRSHLVRATGGRIRSEHFEDLDRTRKES